MEFSGVIMAGLKTFIGALLPPLKKKYFDQPKIYLIFQFSNSFKSPRRPPPKNNMVNPNFDTEAIYYNDLTWEYKIIFRNNSEYAAYNIKLIKPTLNKEFNIYPPLDRLKPILSNSEISYIAKFYEFYEGKGKVANRIVNRPPKKLKSGKFTLEYTNVKGTKFYTIYNCNEEEEKRHQFTRSQKNKI